jgi:hypothetical protein
MGVRAHDDDGAELNADYSVQPDGLYLSLILESGGGRSRDGLHSRNHQYVPALTLLLRRLADRNAVLLGAMVASAPLARRSEEERTVKHGPVELAGVQDFDQLRLELTTPQGRIGLADPNAKPGNNRKRLQLRIEVPGYAADDAARLESDLAFPARLTGRLPAAGELLRSLIGQEIYTVTGHPNMVLAVNSGAALVRTSQSPDGQMVTMAEVQDGLDKLGQQGTVGINTGELGHRSSFIGAVLATLPGTQITLNPARITLGVPPVEEVGSDPAFAVLDGTAAAKVRKEQATLRSLLAGGRDLAACALCGQEYPMQFLVAAHVKKRSLCSDEERRDLQHVAMLACVFGCDTLYESGWITVGQDGRVQTIPPTSTPGGRIGQHLQALQGRQCTAHNLSSETYFAWHRTIIFRGDIPT